MPSAHPELWAITVRLRDVPFELPAVERLLYSVVRARGGVAGRQLRQQLASSDVEFCRRLAEAFLFDGFFSVQARDTAPTLHISITDTDAFFAHQAVDLDDVQ